MSPNESTADFLKEKFKKWSFKDLVRLQIEALTFWLVESIPSLPGFFLRNLWAALFFKNKVGFCWIQPRVTFVHTDRLSIGSHFGVNTGCYINAIGGIEIGNHVLLGSNITISSGVHPISGAYPPIYSRPTIPKKITIEDDVWIGAGAVILPGITLKKGTVVGANAVVTKDTQEYSIVVGVPAQIKGYRNKS